MQAGSHDAGVSDADLRAAVVREADVREAFSQGETLEATTPWGRLVVDGARPFLLVLRTDQAPDPLSRLLRGEASYLIAETRDEDRHIGSLRDTVRMVAGAGTREHGAFLVVELWGGGDRFRVLGPDGPAKATVAALVEGLATMGRRSVSAAVEMVPTDARHPHDLPPLLTVEECHRLGCLLLGLQVPELYRDPHTGELYPVFLRELLHELSRVLRRAVFEFVKVQTGKDLSSYRALGRRSLGDAVWAADRELAEIDASFDTLLLVSPVNAEAAWERFRDGGYQRAPDFRYRLLPIDPDLLKRRLYAVRLEDVEDPAAWRLLRDKREELDKQITLMADRNSPGFLQGSIRLFGHMRAPLLERAEEILARIPPTTAPSPPERVRAREFAARAEVEFDYYRARYAGFRSEVQIRPDLTGLMVSSGKLLVGESLSLWPDRVEALIQHEVGTHVLTYVNGAAQPFLQLSRGFADYDELQEGLGVLAEYLVGGLNSPRMRLLAARVLAVHCLMEGATFVDTFRRLHDDHGFGAYTAFGITARVYEGGGFTRDMIYLRGLMEVVEYLRDGGELEAMYVGKIAARHLEVIQEFRERGVLRPTPLMPRFLEQPYSLERLRALRDGLPVYGMVTPLSETD
jgi:uncharacterized protein (TIGR02421 family)